MEKKLTYNEMYLEAMDKTQMEYKGYTRANALSLYVDDKYNVNAVANRSAHDALCNVYQSVLDD